MPQRPECDNVAVRHGEWGEDRAVEYLRLHGYEILDRNSRPYGRDHRLEIDIVAYELASDTLVFIEVKQHASHSPWERRLRSVNSRKKRNLKVAFNAWRRKNRWAAGYRFDVIEIYGSPTSRSPEIDHIENVDIFVQKSRFVNWR